MPSGGSALQMVQTIRFNKSLLSNRKSFGELRSFLERRIEKRGGNKLKKIDPKELKKIKTEIRTELKKERKRTNFIVGWLIVFAVSLLSYFIYALYKSPPVYKGLSYGEDVESANKKAKAEQNKFDFYISDGNKWLVENDFHNSIFQFELAVSKQPDNYDANLGLAKSYLKACWIEEISCTQADSQLNVLLANFDDNTNAKQEISKLLVSIGNLEKAKSLE